MKRFLFFVVSPLYIFWILIVHRKIYFNKDSVLHDEMDFWKKIRFELATQMLTKEYLEKYDFKPDRMKDCERIMTYIAFDFFSSEETDFVKEKENLKKILEG